MDAFAKLPAEEKLPYFQFAAAETGLSPSIIEKDFWVCWTLKRLFIEASCKDHLIFKGGTSLSKVYKLIERFSEDIDISINKSYFGFCHDNDPENSPSTKKQTQVLKSLSDACSNYVEDQLQHELTDIFSKYLADDNTLWKLEIDETDPSHQSLLFHYPSLTKSSTNYVRQFVKIEMGARSDHWPAQDRIIYPILDEVRTNTLKDPAVKIKALSAERTFWEKATILHKYAHFPEQKNIPERQSRHFFDFYKLLKSDVADYALNDLTVLERVVEHKQIYFRAAWANYGTAQKGTLKLVPDNRVLKAMEKDYEKMAEMFYGSNVTWHEIVDALSEFEMRFNQR